MWQCIYAIRYAEYVDVCQYLNNARPGMPSLCMGVLQEPKSFKVGEKCSSGLLKSIIYREPQKMSCARMRWEPKKNRREAKKNRRNASERARYSGATPIIIPSPKP